MHAQTFVCIGAGNVAWHLCPALTGKGFILRQVCSRTKESALRLSSAFKCDLTTSVKDIVNDADFYLVAVSDMSIQNVLDELTFFDRLVIHTSGSTGTDVFGTKFSRFGVMYPLQTFTREIRMDISKVPFLIEGSDESSAGMIRFIAEKLSGSVHAANSEQRKWFHISAVFASNFTNYMYASANEILKSNNLDFRLLFPLMEETLRKAEAGDPVKMQTGPAKRGDTNVIRSHIKLLSSNPVLQKLYTFISNRIYNYYSDHTGKN